MHELTINRVYALILLPSSPLSMAEGGECADAFVQAHILVRYSSYPPYPSFHLQPRPITCSTNLAFGLFEETFPLFDLPNQLGLILDCSPLPQFPSLGLLRPTRRPIPPSLDQPFEEMVPAEGGVPLRCSCAQPPPPSPAVSNGTQLTTTLRPTGKSVPPDRSLQSFNSV